MPDDDLAERNFRTDLEQLAFVADNSLPALSELLQRQVDAHNKFDGVSPGTMSTGVDSAFYSLNGTLRDRVRQASVVIEETAQALHDIAYLYKRADGQA
ncbi:hypothetical protein [Actinokineospora xionganensis]|uniref:PE family protein n=1 Tax=Actinokineospora xionganensis TaxID=2684470 RepID=A0ABR7LFV3_9PSEU|nr:hypothetical protein [Actinokineospora xionganensis]MBC6451162.1 hypothetical protein [Actinokineospora xionganensis]